MFANKLISTRWGMYVHSTSHINKIKWHYGRDVKTKITYINTEKYEMRHGDVPYRNILINYISQKHLLSISQSKINIFGWLLDIPQIEHKMKEQLNTDDLLSNVYVISVDINELN